MTLAIENTDRISAPHASLDSGCAHLVFTRCLVEWAGWQLLKLNPADFLPAFLRHFHEDVHLSMTMVALAERDVEDIRTGMPFEGDWCRASGDDG